EDAHHAQRRQSCRSVLAVVPAQQRRGAGTARVHHQHARADAPAGARPPGARDEPRAPPRDRSPDARLRGPHPVLRRSPCRGVAMIAAAFWPKDVIVRLSDFKSNEYANLLGGEAFEPKEENPMLGFRGASRYYDERYREGFALECRAMRKVRDEMGLENVKLMVPFCRTVEEGRRVMAELEANGL